jgi:hypothetical protein
MNYRDAHDPVDNMLLVKSMQNKWRDSFVGAALDPAKWGSVIGPGGAASVASGQLTLGSGANANAETYIMSPGIFTVPFRAWISLQLSQRIANQTFFIELVSVDPQTRMPDGKHVAAWFFDATTATQAKYRVQNGGGTPLDSAAQTIATTASMSVFEIELFADEAWFHQRALDSAAGRAFSQVRHQQIPDPTAFYALRLRWLNGATPPASNTNAILQFALLTDYAELTAEITAGRGQTAAGQGIGVIISGAAAAYNLPENMAQVGGQAVVVNGNGVQAVAQHGGAATNAVTNAEFVSAASNNATVLKASAGRLFRVLVNNINAAWRYLKIYNKATAPAPGTDVPIAVIPIPPNGNALWESSLGMYCSAGISYALVAGIANNDNTSVAAAEHVASLGYS